VMEKITNKRGHALVRFIPMESEEQTNPEIHRPLEASLVVAIRNGRVLLVFDRYKQCWEIPGGAIEPGEKPLMCAIREFTEESGQSIEKLNFIGLAEICLNNGHKTFTAVYTGWLEGLLPFLPNDEIEIFNLWDFSTDIGYIDDIDRYIAEVGKIALDKLLR
jgi:8-oxo-dGTP diphosphatase